MDIKRCYLYYLYIRILREGLIKVFLCGRIIRFIKEDFLCVLLEYVFELLKVLYLSFLYWEKKIDILSYFFVLIDFEI